MKILDLACAELGSKLGQYKDDERLLTDALGVIEEQGVYAFFLFLEARSKETSNACAQFLRAQGLLQNADCVLDALRRDVATKLDTLLFARDLLRQSLVYARYHAKASEQERPGQQQGGRQRQGDGGTRRQNRNDRERNRSGRQRGDPA